MQDADSDPTARPFGVSAPEALVLRMAPGAPEIMGAATAAKSQAVAAVANHGRWIVECPTGDGGAQLASRQDPRFMCVECLNASIDGAWRRVKWPKAIDEIEEILDAREPEGTRNWAEGETPDDLRREDAEHADAAPMTERIEPDENDEVA